DVAAVAGGAGAGDSDDVAGGLDHFPNAVRGVIGDEEIAAAVHRHAHRVSQPGGGGRPAVAAVGPGAVARHGDDVARRFDHAAETVIVKIGDEESAAGGPGHAGRPGQLGGGRRPAVAAVAGDAGAGHGDDVARRLDDLADAAVVEIRDEHVAAAVHRHRP